MQGNIFLALGGVSVNFFDDDAQVFKQRMGNNPDVYQALVIILYKAGAWRISSENSPS